MTPDERPPDRRKGRAQPHRKRDYTSRKPRYTRILWRLAYFDPDWGRCFAWAESHAQAIAMRGRMREHYTHDTPTHGTHGTHGTHAPEILIGRVLIPIGTRQELAAWLSEHATYEPPRPRYGAQGETWDA